MADSVKVEQVDDDLALLIWRVHPREIQDSGLTRPDWYAQHIARHRIEAERAGYARGIEALESVWEQARENHARYSATGCREQDIRFFGLALAGEAGEVANFIKKRWRDGEAHEADLRAECADVFAYNIMLSDALGMSASDLLNEVARKQQVFLDKMAAIRAKGQDDVG